jgi:[ribosomal protein S18]-alanine N-acetyltransferase
MEESDLPFVMEIELLSFSLPWPESSFRGEIENRGFSRPSVVIDSSRNRIIGYLLFWLANDEARICNFAVHPDYQRQGVGRYVLEKSLQTIQRLGGRFVLLEVRPTNFPARRLYSSFGFRPLAIRKNYYTNPIEDALVMVKRFDPAPGRG